MRFVLLLFIIMPIVEIALIIQVGQVFGMPITIGLIILTAVIGTYLLRREGVATLFRARQKMDSGQIPAKEMGEGVMLAFAGALLLTPGFVTDAVGFSLLSRKVRTELLNKVSKFGFISGSFSAGKSDQNRKPDSSYIDAEYRREKD